VGKLAPANSFVMTDIKFLPRVKTLYAKSLDDAYEKGYFSGSMNREELYQRILKHNDTLRVRYTKTHGGLWDRGRFVTAIGRCISIPRFTICHHDSKFDETIIHRNEWGEEVSREVKNMDEMNGYVYMRGWTHIIRDIMKKGYKVDTRGLSL